MRAMEARAREALSRDVYDYYAGGAEDEITLAANEAAFRDVFFRPRVLVDVSGVDTSLELLGSRLEHPVILAPTAFQRLAHPEGEAATARAAAATGALMVASSLSTLTIEAIAGAAPSAPRWLQLYVFRDRGLSESLVRRAEAAGCSAVCLTVSVPVQGNRERDAHNRFALPDGMEMANFTGHLQAHFPDARGGSALGAFIQREFDPTLTWEALAWLRSVTRLPVVVKGVMTSEDGRLAVDHGADAVVVSNHGGRQLDGAEPTLRALPRVADAVEGRVPVLMDGGVRRGTDVAKAMALGATAVMVGRPYLWGLAVAGQGGVEHVVGMLVGELRRTMALLGRPTLGALDRSALAGA
ncbi:MAG: alpha-hydroxy-acid oxidizing protein [Gemmatimonadetes bacterium]|nr:alpha-hydroxy-acid oxidizing protein [Gemmatimonadota bacterium]